MRLRMAVKRKQLGLLSRSVILLHDNARPHSTTITRLLLEDFKWDVFRHSPVRLPYLFAAESGSCRAAFPIQC